MTITYETDYDEVRRALTYLDPNDRETWWKAGAALKSEFDEGGRSLWEDWGRGYPKWNQREANAQWKSFKHGHIHIGTLFHMAKDNGFTFSQNYRAPSAEEIAHREVAWAVKREVQDAWDKVSRDHAARTANIVWENANTRPADAGFPYLSDKGITDPAVLSNARINRFKDEDRLVIPMYDRPNHIVNRQAIDANGGKFFLPGGEVGGAYGKIAAPNSDWTGGVYLAEGFATAASIHTATGKPVIIAFNAGNLPKVAAKMAQMLPENTPVYIAADNDASQTGIKKAAEAAQVLGNRARVVMPEFTGDEIARFQQKHGQDSLPSDFNDLHELQGLEAVKTALSTPLSHDRLPETEIRLGSVFTLNGTMGRNALVIGRKSDPDTGRTEYAYLKYDTLSPETVSVRKIFGNPQTIGDWRDGSSAVRYYQAPHYGEAYFREHWGGEIGKLQSAGFETVSLHGLKNIFDGKEIEAPSPQSDVRPDPAELHRIRETELAKIQNEKIRAAVRQELARRDGLGQSAQHETVQQQGLDEGGDTPFTRAVDAVMENRHIPQRHIPLGTTPPALQLAGLPDTQIEIQAHVLHKILAGKHYLTADDIKRLPSELNNPVAVLRSSPTSQNPDGFVVMTELKESDYDLNNRPVNKSVIASLFLKETPKGLQVIGISSVYGRWKSQIENAVKNDTVLYWHKEKGFQLLNSLGLRLPPRLSSDENLSKLNIKTETDLAQWQNAQKRPIQPNPQQFIPAAPQEKTMAQSPTLTPEQIRSYAQRIANITDEADRNAAIDEFAENHGTNIRRQVGEILQEREARVVSEQNENLTEPQPNTTHTAAEQAAVSVSATDKTTPVEKHYSEQIIDQLTEQHGWKKQDALTAQKTFQGISEGGMLNPDGNHVMYARFNETGRYLALESGWDTVFDIDARDIAPPTAAEVFDRYAGQYARQNTVPSWDEMFQELHNSSNLYWERQEAEQSPQQQPQVATEQAADTQSESATEAVPDEENGIEFDGEAQDLEQKASEAEPAFRQPENTTTEWETITAEEVRQNLARARAAEAMQRQDGQKQPVPERQPENVPQQQETRPQTAPEADLGSLFDEAAPQPAREPAPSENPSVPQKPKPVLDLDYETASGLNQRYIRMEGKYLDLNNRTTVMFEDQGGKIKTAAADPQVIRDMLDTAQAKNWGSIKISGSREFKQAMWLEAELRGIPSTGYKPGREDLALRDQLLADRQRNGIEQIQPQQSRQPENSSVQSSSAEPHSQDRKVQAAESQKGVMLLEHGAAPYLHNPDNRTNYFVKYEQDGEIRERWGVELESALTESGAQAGDRIEIHDLGRQPVVVNILVRDESGKIVRDEQGNKVFEEKEVEKNLFRIEVLERQQDRQPENVRVRQNGPLPDQSALVHSEAAQAAAKADTSKEKVLAAEIQHRAAQFANGQQRPTGQAAATPNHALESARALYQQQLGKSRKEVKATVQYLENIQRKMTETLEPALRDRQMQRFYESVTADMKSGNIPTPKRTAGQNQTHRNETWHPAHEQENEQEM